MSDFFLFQDLYCDTDRNCNRTYVSDYEYLGGYYGGCNEEIMMEALVTRGPLAVGFYARNDFLSYSSGIYRALDLQRDFDPFTVRILYNLYNINHASNICF